MSTDTKYQKLAQLKVELFIFYLSHLFLKKLKLKYKYF